MIGNTPIPPDITTKENTIPAGTTSQYFRGDKTFQTLDKTAVGLSNVDNTSDVNKPISNATQLALNSKFNTPTGTTNRLAKFATANTIGDSQIFDDGKNVGIGTDRLNLSARLDVQAQGTLRTDIAFRIRNSSDTIDLFSINGLGQVGISSTKNLPALFLKGSALSAANDFVELTFGTTGSASRLAAIAGVFVNPQSNARTHLSFSTTGASFGEGMRLTDNKNLLIGTTTDSGARLQVQAQGVLATDIAFRIRNSTDTSDLLSVNGLGLVGINTNSTATSDEKLHIRGSMLVYNSTNNIRIGFDANNWNVINGRANGLTFTTSNSGFAELGNINLQPQSNSSIVHRTSGLTGVHVFFSGGNFERLRIDSNGNIGIGTATPNLSAILDISSSTKGFLPPRMTTAQVNAIATPTAGLIVYDTTTNKHKGFNGTNWNDLY